MINSIKINCDVKSINNKLLKLYTIIPRKMDNVKNHILGSINNQSELECAQRFLSNEQDALDSMGGQVKLLKQQKNLTKEVTSNIKGKINKKPKELNILEQMGLKIEVESDEEKLILIRKLVGSNLSRVKQIYKVVNEKTQKKFDAHIKKAKIKSKRLLWHGSRNENIFNIVQTGLLIRPSGVIHTGSMWDDGIYFALDADKALGYVNGGRWAGGGGRYNKVFLGMFDVNVGKQLVKNRHDSSCYSISKEIKNSDYDSVHAKKGVSLRKDEFIIYNSNQCTIKYLIEME